MTKIETIEKLDNAPLIELTKTLLGFIGFKDVRVDGVVIRAEEESVLGATLHAFVIPDAQLSGAVDMDAIGDLLSKARDEESFNVVTFVSNRHISSGFQANLNRKFPELLINYIGRDNLIRIIDDKFPDYWRHDDMALIEYEHQYEEVMDKENQLKLLHLPTDKYKRIVSIFIQPSLIEEVEESSSHRLLRKRVEMSEVLKSKQSAIISGQAGAGKSTLLYNIGLSLSKENSTLTSVRLSKRKPQRGSS